METNRRQFIINSSILAFAFYSASANFLSCLKNKNFEDDLYIQLVKSNCDDIPELLKKQEQNTSHRRYDGLKNNLEIHNAGETAHFIKVLTCAYSVPESRFYKSTKLLESMEIATQYLLNVQHNDGTIDLYSTNFHSPPDTAFVLEPLCAALSVLNQYDSPSLSKLKTDLKTFILKAADALTVGGIHTPNHRWVVCMALARVHSLFPN